MPSQGRSWPPHCGPAHERVNVLGLPTPEVSRLQQRRDTPEVGIIVARIVDGIPRTDRLQEEARSNAHLAFGEKGLKKTRSMEGRIRGLRTEPVYLGPSYRSRDKMPRLSKPLAWLNRLPSRRTPVRPQGDPRPNAIRSHPKNVDKMFS